MTNNQEQIALLRSQVTLYKEKMAVLEHEVQALRKQTSNLVKEKEDILKMAQFQIEEKSTTIAQLVTKLHQAQLLIHTMQQQHSVSSSPPPSTGFYPLPPKEPPPGSPIRTPRGHITRRAIRRTETFPQQIVSNNCTVESEPAARKPSTLGSHLISPSTESLVKSRDHLLREQPQMLTRSLKVRQTQKPILPPIQSNEVLDTAIMIPPPPNPLPPTHRPRYSVNKGLSSAPCSLRLVNYSSPHHSAFQQEESKSMKVEEGKDSEATEGTLLIKHQAESLYYKPQAHRK